MSDSKRDSLVALPSARAATASRPSPAVLGQAGIANAVSSLRVFGAQCKCGAVDCEWTDHASRDLLGGLVVHAIAVCYGAN